MAGFPDIRVSRYPDFRKSGFPDIRITGYPDIGKSGNPDFRTSGNPDFRKSGFPDIRISGFPDIRIFVFVFVFWGYPMTVFVFWGAHTPCSLSCTPHESSQERFIHSHRCHPEIRISGNPEIRCVFSPMCRFRS